MAGPQPRFSSRCRGDASAGKHAPTSFAPVSASRRAPAFPARLLPMWSGRHGQRADMHVERVPSWVSGNGRRVGLMDCERMNLLSGSDDTRPPSMRKANSVQCHSTIVHTYTHIWLQTDMPQHVTDDVFLPSRHGPCHRIRLLRHGVFID